MPRLLARGLIYLIAGFVVCAFFWAALGQVDVVVTAHGTVIPLGEVVKVQTQFPGVVSQIFVREGQEVAIGDPLVQLDALEKKNRIVQARMDREALLALLELLQTESSTYEGLVDRGVIAKLEFITKKKEYENAKRKLVQLESELDLAQANQGKMLLRSPANGKIAFMHVHGLEQIVSASEVVARIVPKSAPLIMELRVANKDIAKVKLGQACKHLLDAYPYQDFGMLQGRIVHISSDALLDASGNRAYVLRATFDVPEYRSGSKRFPIFAGLAGTTHIVTRRQRIIAILLEPFRKMRSGFNIDA
jgi:multidrug efflux pump subunit AcrA (membrane-fusion protein)